MSEPVCSTCRFFLKIVLFKLGKCLRHAPVIMDKNAAIRFPGDGAYPLTEEDDWCGDYEAKGIPFPLKERDQAP